MTDNAQSRAVHERGVQHQEAVARSESSRGLHGVAGVHGGTGEEAAAALRCTRALWMDAWSPVGLWVCQERASLAASPALPPLHLRTASHSPAPVAALPSPPPPAAPQS